MNNEFQIASRNPVCQVEAFLASISGVTERVWGGLSLCISLVMDLQPFRGVPQVDFRVTVTLKLRSGVMEQDNNPKQTRAGERSKNSSC